MRIIFLFIFSLSANIASGNIYEIARAKNCDEEISKADPNFFKESHLQNDLSHCALGIGSNQGKENCTKFEYIHTSGGKGYENRDVEYKASPNVMVPVKRNISSWYNNTGLYQLEQAMKESGSSSFCRFYAKQAVIDKITNWYKKHCSNSHNYYSNKNYCNNARSTVNNIGAYIAIADEAESKKVNDESNIFANLGAETDFQAETAKFIPRWCSHLNNELANDKTPYQSQLRAQMKQNTVEVEQPKLVANQPNLGLTRTQTEQLFRKESAGLDRGNAPTSSQIYNQAKANIMTGHQTVSEAFKASPLSDPSSCSNSLRGMHLEALRFFDEADKNLLKEQKSLCDKKYKDSIEAIAGEVDPKIWEENKQEYINALTNGMPRDALLREIQNIRDRERLQMLEVLKERRSERGQSELLMDPSSYSKVLAAGKEGALSPESCDHSGSRHGIGISGALTAGAGKFLQIEGGIECLSQQDPIQAAIDESSLKLNCYCAAGGGASYGLGVGASASLNVGKIQTFGDCRQAGDYEGGFQNTGVGFGGSVLGVDTALSATIGIGIDQGRGNIALREAKFGGNGQNSVKFKEQMEKFFQFAINRTSKDRKYALGAVALTSYISEQEVIRGIKGIGSLLFQSQVNKQIEELNPEVKENNLDSILINDSPLSDGETTKFFHQPLNELFDEYVQTVGGDEEQYDRLKVFMDQMLKDENGRLGGGFLGKCHGFTIGASVGASLPGGAPPFTPNLSKTYTEYVNVFDVELNGKNTLCGVLTFGIGNGIGNSLAAAGYNNDCAQIDTKKNLFSACAEVGEKALKSKYELEQLLDYESTPYQEYKNPYKPKTMFDDTYDAGKHFAESFRRMHEVSYFDYHDNVLYGEAASSNIHLQLSDLKNCGLQ